MWGHDWRIVVQVAQVGNFSGYSLSSSTESRNRQSKGKDNMAMQRKRAERFKELQVLGRIKVIE